MTGHHGLQRSWRKGVATVAFASALVLTSPSESVAGAISSQSFESTALGRAMNVDVYTPDGEVPDGGWQTLYLLHGLGGNETDWALLGDIGKTLDRLIEMKVITPLIVVMPGADNSWYVDSANVGGPGDFETAVVNDLSGFVEASYPVRRDAAGRAIAGLSMGGFGALRLALAFPERFCAAAALSPAMWQNVPADEIDDPPEQMTVIADSEYFHRQDEGTFTTGVDVPPPGPHFNGAFGTPFDPLRFNRQNVFSLLAERVEANTKLPAIFVTVGDDDSHKLWRGAIAFYETMQADQRSVEFRVTDGDHTWALWRRSVVDAFQFIDTAFSAKCHP